nr:MAG TPA: hypothetical protein [Caudoviricetes sp.]DAN17685.1 MAG TPA: hypothetical protein [Caudoviricetes sp.]
MKTVCRVNIYVFLGYFHKIILSYDFSPLFAVNFTFAIFIL